MSVQHPRDRAIDAMLGRSGGPGASTADCLDAETLAAWADGGLDEVGLARAEAHMASCSRCQLAMMSIVSSAVDSSPRHAGHSGTPWWLDLRWLVPLAGAAAAVLVWMVVPGTPVPQQRMARSDGTPQPPTYTAPPASAVEAPAATATPSPPPSEPTPAEELKQMARAEPTAPTAEADRQAPTEKPEAAAPRANENVRERAPGRTAQEEARDVAAADALRKAAPLPAAPPPANAAGSPLDARVAAADAATGAITSADAAVRWRFAGVGAVERSVDGGVTWTASSTGVQTPLAAGASPSATVCWVVGRGGLVLLTVDARTWRTLGAPASADLVAVEASSDREAVVRTASGQSFRTTDAGRTWTGTVP